jgi:hypothetical protein
VVTVVIENGLRHSTPVFCIKTHLRTDLIARVSSSFESLILLASASVAVEPEMLTIVYILAGYVPRSDRDQFLAAGRFSRFRFTEQALTCGSGSTPSTTLIAPIDYIFNFFREIAIFFRTLFFKGLGFRV